LLSPATQKSETNTIERKYLTKKLQLSKSGVSLFLLRKKYHQIFWLKGKREFSKTTNKSDRQRAAKLAGNTWLIRIIALYETAAHRILSPYNMVKKIGIHL